MQKIIAELSAAVLCRIIGKRSGDTLDNSYRYIEAYAKKLGIKPHCACMKVMGDAEKVLHLILDAGKMVVQN